MCLAFFAVQASEHLPLLVVFNRDEDYIRPTDPLSFWEGEPQIFGGRDRLKGGTWAGATTSGRLGFLTFYREPKLPNRNWKPRGHLVSDFLRSELPTEDFLANVNKSADNYLGFNLVVGQGLDLFHYSNRSNEITRLTNGVHGLSNAVLNTPWPKVTKGVAAIEELMASGNPKLESCWELMRDDSRVSDHLLPSTGVSLERERELSSLFVTTPNYGTLSTSILTLDSSGLLRFSECNYERGKGANAKSTFRNIEGTWPVLRSSS